MAKCCNLSKVYSLVNERPYLLTPAICQCLHNVRHVSTILTLFEYCVVGVNSPCQYHTIAVAANEVFFFQKSEKVREAKI